MPALGNSAFSQAYTRRKQIREERSEWTKASHQRSASGAAAKRVANSNREDKTMRPQASLDSEVAKHCVNESTKEMGSGSAAGCTPGPDCAMEPWSRDEETG